jgi:hypothetical protein
MLEINPVNKKGDLRQYYPYEREVAHARATYLLLAAFLVIDRIRILGHERGHRRTIQQFP